MAATEGLLRRGALLLLSVAVAACSPPAPGQGTPTNQNAKLVKGPPIEDITTPFDDALSCLSGKVPGTATFAVGNITDSTGKEAYNDSGTGKFITAGAGDIVQSALFRAGLKVVNRRDPNISLAEHNWGIRNLRDLEPADFYITGSINSIDFIPGGGYDVEIAGVGPRKRQNRVLVGLDLALTNAFDGQVVADVPLQKQIFFSEQGWASNRFFGKGLVMVDAGGMTREAEQLALREMLSYATLQLLAQVIEGQAVNSCMGLVSPADGSADGRAPFTRRAPHTRALNQMVAESRAADAKVAGLMEGTAPNASGAHPAGPAQPSPPEARKLANDATTFAAKAIAAADAAETSKTFAEAKPQVMLAMAYTKAAVTALRQAAAKGLTGPEGDAAAVVVKQAFDATQKAEQDASLRPDATAAPTPSPTAAAPPPSQAPSASPSDPVAAAKGTAPATDGK